MNENEKIETILKTAQRFISANDLNKYVNYLYDLGITDEDIRKYSSDYCVANTIGFME